MRNSYYAIVATITLCIASSGAWAQSCYTTDVWQQMPKQKISIIKSGKPIVIEARIADNNIERAAGYQWICADQAQNTATLFSYARNITASFHMRNVFVPLDIYFFDEQGRQVNAMIMRPEPPGKNIESRLYHSIRKFRYALEIVRPVDHDLTQMPSPLALAINSL